MDFLTYSYCLLAILTLQVSAFSPRNKPPSGSGIISDDMEWEFPQDDWKKPFLDFQGKKAFHEDDFDVAFDEKTVSSKARISPHLKSDFTWWPSKVDYSDAFNEIPKSSSESPRHDAKKPATFEELENRNANRYNPLLNLDHYPIPSKKYTFVELENMNANQYNPYLD